ncbi:MAG TPA: hypothetical protein VIQ80_02555 [Candidatus Saccharimonadales bacterium]
MDTASADDGSAILNDSFGLATWNRPRTDEELRAFITTHHNRLPDDIDVE